MNGLVFEAQAPVLGSAPNRADIAAFVGFVPRRPGVMLPGASRDWLVQQGWTSPPYQRAPAEVEALDDLPLPIESWELFDALFAWQEREVEGSIGSVPTYLGTAIRSFFAQGGRMCYVVRAGDPLPIGALRSARLAHLARLVPGYPYGFNPSAVDRSSWRGLGHLFGLPDVSFVCLPDLADLVAGDPLPPTLALPLLPLAPERFVECSVAQPPSGVDNWSARLRAPRCGDVEYDDWGRAVRVVGEVLARLGREAQLVAALPLPRPEAAATRDLLSFLIGRGAGPLANSLDAGGVASAFVQLVYPWVRTAGSTALPEQVESPDGVLVGMLARNALLNGAFRSIGGQPLVDVYDLEPVLPRDQMFSRPDAFARRSLAERVSLFGHAPDRLRLLSDVTASLDETYRPASVNRLVATIVRTARRLGEEALFEVSDDALWARMRDRIEELLRGLLADGALNGATESGAFRVRCDESTMTQNDLDNGRLVAEIVFDAAAPIQEIRVVFALRNGGNLAIQSVTSSAQTRVAA